MKTGYKIFFSAVALLILIGLGCGIKWLVGGIQHHEPEAPAATTPAAPTPTEVAATASPPPPIFQLQTTTDTVSGMPPALAHLAPAGITGCLVDAADGRVLWQKDPEKLVPIASMTKMMSTLVAIEEIDRRLDLTLDTGVKISQAAMDVGGSQVYLGKDEIFTLRELLAAMMIHSANDCAYAVAEATGPDYSVTKFVTLMNRRARELGMVKTRFYNVNGLPEKDPNRDCQSTAAEMVMLGKHLLDSPLIMEWAGTWHMPFRPNAKEPLIMQNRNRLVNTCPGVNGLKTGFIDRSGFCVTVTCTRNDRTLIACVTGFESANQRNTFVAALLDWAYTRP